MATALDLLNQHESGGIVDANAPMKWPEVYPEDEIDDLSANEEDYIQARTSTVMLPNFLEPQIQYPLGKDNAMFRDYQKTLGASPFGEGLSIAGKGLSLVGDLLTRVNKVATSTPVMQVGIENLDIAAESFNANLYHMFRYYGVVSSLGQMSGDEAKEWASSFTDVENPRSYFAMGKDSLFNLTGLFSPKKIGQFAETVKAAVTPVSGSMKDMPTLFDAIGEGYYKTLTGEEPSDAWKMGGNAAFETIAASPMEVASLIGKARNIKSLGAPLGIFSNKPLTVIEKGALMKSHTSFGTEILAKYPSSARAELWKINKMKWYNRYSTLEYRMERRTLSYKNHLKTLLGRPIREQTVLPEAQVEEGRSFLDLLLSNFTSETKRKEAEIILSRSKKFREAGHLRKELGGKQGAISARWALKGDDYDHAFDVDLSWVTPEIEDKLFNIVQSLPEWDAQHASTALFKILNKKGATIPNKSEAKALELAFGPGIVSKIEAASGRSLDWAELFTDLMNLPRALQTSFDVGWGFRQGEFALKSGHVNEWASSWAAMVKAGGPSKYWASIDDLATNGPRASLYKKSGLKITKWGKDVGLHAKEEEYLSNIAEKIPVMGEVVKWSERTHATALNNLRMNLFDSTLLQWQREGRVLAAKDYKALGEYVNHMTGRGDLKTAQRALDGVFGLFGKAGATTELKVPIAASGVMYSPRFFLSKLQVHTDLFGTESNLVRKLVARDLTNYYRTNIQILRMADAGADRFGWEVETDPTSGDFGKIKAGNRRWDVWGPMNPIMRYMARLETGTSKSITTGDISDISRTNLNLRFMRSQLSPTMGLVMNLGTGETFIGDSVSITEPKDLGKIAFESLVPLTPQDITDSFMYGSKNWFAHGAVGTAFLGVGVGTYKPSAFQLAYQKKEVMSKELFGKPISDLKLEERAMLQKAASYDTELIMLERRGMFEDPDDIVEIAAENQIRNDKDIRKMLPKQMRNALDKTFTTVGPVSKTIHISGIPIKLKYKEQQVYKKLIAKNIEQFFFDQTDETYFNSEINEKIVHESIKAAERQMAPIIQGAE